MLEYKGVQKPFKELVETLNTLAEWGWELVEIDLASDPCRAVLKRPFRNGGPEPSFADNLDTSLIEG